MKILALFSLVIFVGCSSTEERSGSYKKSPPEDGLVDLTETPKKKETSPEPLPPVKDTNSEDESKSKSKSLDELDRAIQKQDEFQIAVSARQMLIQNPQDPKALNALALYHFRKGELGAAKALLNKAIAAHPNISMLFSNLGIVLQTMDEDIEAVRAFREALKVDPFNAVAAANVGAYYARVKDYSKAQVALELAVQKGQRDWRTINNYGVTLMALGKYPLAETQLKKASELQPQNVQVLMNYASLLVEHISKPAEGLEVLNKIRFIGPGPDLRKKISELEIKAKSLK
jgi:Flp pilus assembly protein TadD